MNNSLNIIRKIFGFIVMCMLLFSLFLVVHAESFVLFSRISNVEAITIVETQNTENYTEFKIEVNVEVLNTIDENKTIVIPCIRTTRTFINATLSNQSLSCEQIFGPSLPSVIFYTYAPGITTKNDSAICRVNQSDLESLPDGTYTLWYTLNAASNKNAFAKELYTNFTVDSGKLNVSYAVFEYVPTDNTSGLNTLVLVGFVSAGVLLKRKLKKRF